MKRTLPLFLSFLIGCSQISSFFSRSEKHDNDQEDKNGAPCSPTKECPQEYSCYAPVLVAKFIKDSETNEIRLSAVETRSDKMCVGINEIQCPMKSGKVDEARLLQMYMQQKRTAEALLPGSTYQLVFVYLLPDKDSTEI